MTKCRSFPQKVQKVQRRVFKDFFLSGSDDAPIKFPHQYRFSNLWVWDCCIVCLPCRKPKWNSPWTFHMLLPGWKAGLISWANSDQRPIKYISGLEGRFLQGSEKVLSDSHPARIRSKIKIAMKKSSQLEIEVQ